MRDDFEAKNKQLLDEMPRFYNSRLDYFQPSFESLIDPRLLPLGSGPALRLDFYILCRPAQSQHVVVSPAVVSDPGPGDKAQWTFWGEEGCEHWSKCCRGQSIESCLTTRG